MKAIFLLGMLVSTSAFANADFDSANQAFAEQRYADAITDYRALVSSGIISAPLLFNLGNAYAKTGDTGHAVASYLRARMLAPNDPAISQNLERLANVPQNPWQRVSMNAWSVIAAGALLAFGIALVAKRRWLMIAASTALLAAIVAIALWVPTLSSAVVVTQAPVRISPFSAAEAAFTASPGNVVQLHETHGDFVRMTDVAGHSGWLEEKSVTRLIDAS